MSKKQKRQQQKDDGMFDGRYKTKVIPDKKKRKNKDKARKKIKHTTED